MTMLPMKFRWHRGRFQPEELTDGARLLVADSWRVERGTVWGLENHIQRFLRGCAAQGESLAHLAAPVSANPLAAAVQKILTAAETNHPEVALFPRLSLEQRAHHLALVLLLRAAPPVRTTTRLHIPQYTDPRTRPTVKGPDIDLMRGLVAEADADDVVLHDGTNVTETTTGALLLWDTPEHLVLCQSTQQLASISAQRIADHARSRGISVTTRPVTIQDLVSGAFPVWCTNTLHGISPVTTLRSATGETVVAAHPDTAAWQRSWWQRLSD